MLFQPLCQFLDRMILVDSHGYSLPVPYVPGVIGYSPLVSGVASKLLCFNRSREGHP